MGCIEPKKGKTIETMRNNPTSVRREKGNKEECAISMDEESQPICGYSQRYILKRYNQERSARNTDDNRIYCCM
jgi:hypothetical protein